MRLSETASLVPARKLKNIVSAGAGTALRVWRVGCSALFATTLYRDPKAGMSPEGPVVKSIQTFFLAVTLVGSSGIGLAQDAPETAAKPGLQIGLNDAGDVDGTCHISFLVENRLGKDLSEAVFETVLFDASGAVERLTLFDMRDLPAGRPRVRQFRIDGVSCAGIGRILINGAQTCTGAGVAKGACMDNLTLTSRTDIGLVG
jgi:hypothetical protein